MWHSTRCRRSAIASKGRLKIRSQDNAVLEGNAFGDLLPGVRHGGLDTYAAEVRCSTPTT